MLRTFNCGIGMIAVAPAERADAVAAVLKREGETVVQLGSVTPIKGDATRVTFAGHLDLAG
jgi:phosphoribosylformylglycinamidine cyclo-ligase